jgi:hypothetical protein
MTARVLNSRERAALSYQRKKRGIVRRTVTLAQIDLDALEVRGYLDPDRCGDRADECDAIEMFLGDLLAKPG